MEDFKYLGNEPGLQTFPLMDNLNVQKTQTVFNWSLWNKNTKLYMRHVPANWSSDYEHVVKFDTEQQKKEYLHTGNPVVLETEFRINHDGTIRLPIPYDNVINFNYITAVYPDAPVSYYNHNTARQEYYYFIEDATYIAPNTTELRLELDIWTTYIDDIDVNAMLLERGHLPMTYSSVSDYLNNPLNNSMGLLTEDVRFGQIAKINKDNEWNLYSDATFYVVATTANPKIFIKETTTHNGGQAYKYSDNLFYFGVYETDWPSFCTNIMATCPAFLQTIQGIIAIPTSMIASASSAFIFGGVNCYEVFTWNLSMHYDLSKDDFGYDSKYSWITKLYTYPYAAIEIIDWNGETKLIKIEELYTGSVILQNMGNLNIINPTQTIVLLDVNGNTKSQKINWHINFPHTGVNINPFFKYMFETEYPRLQRTNEINLQKSIADQNAHLSRDFVDIDIKNMSDNNDEINRYDRVMNKANTLNNWHGAVLNELNADMAAKYAGFSTASNALQNSIGGAFGPDGSLTAGMNALSFSISNLQTQNQHDDAIKMIQIGLNQTTDVNRAIHGLPEDGVNYPINAGNYDISLSLGGLTESLNKIHNDNIFDINSNTDRVKAIMNLNNSLDVNSREEKMAKAGIQNAINQSKMNNNVTYGGNSDTSLYEANKMKMKYHVIRLSDDNVKKTGDYFLRYGYSYDGWIDFNNQWKVMTKFTYWKVREVLFNSNQINNKVTKLFKAILERGVTVWNSPTDLNSADVLYSNQIK